MKSRRTYPPRLYTKSAYAHFVPVAPGRTRAPGLLRSGGIARSSRPCFVPLRGDFAGQERGERWRACRFPRRGFSPWTPFSEAPLFEADHHQGAKPLRGDTARLHSCFEGAARWVPAATTPLSPRCAKRPRGRGALVRPSRGSRTRHRCGPSRSPSAGRRAPGAASANESRASRASCPSQVKAQAVVHSRRA